MLLVVKLNDVSSAILEPEKQAWFTLITNSEVLFADQVLHSRVVTRLARVADSVDEKVVTDEICLHGIGPVVDLDTELWIKVVHFHSDVNQRTKVEAFNSILNNRGKIMLDFDLLVDLHVRDKHLNV